MSDDEDDDDDSVDYFGTKETDIISQTNRPTEVFERDELMAFSDYEDDEESVAMTTTNTNTNTNTNKSNAIGLSIEKEDDKEEEYYESLIVFP